MLVELSRKQRGRHSNNDNTTAIKLLCPRGTQTCALAVANIGRLGV